MVRKWQTDSILIIPAAFSDLSDDFYGSHSGVIEPRAPRDPFRARARSGDRLVVRRVLPTVLPIEKRNQMVQMVDRRLGEGTSKKWSLTGNDSAERDPFMGNNYRYDASDVQRLGPLGFA